MGRAGLRAGWGVAVFLLLLGALQIGMALGLPALGIGKADLIGAPGSAMEVILGTAVGLAAVVVATGLMAVVERRPLAAYGLAPRALPLQFGQGALVGLGLLASLVGVLAGLGAIAFDGFPLAGPEALRAGLLWAAACLMVSLLEELVMRGYLLQTLARGIGFLWAAVITSLLFSAGHLANAGESPVGLLSVVLVGLVFCYSVWKTGSLGWAIGFHAAWNWGQSFLFGTGNSGFDSSGNLIQTHATGPAWLSGGATGPEGSVLNIAVLLLAAAFIRWGVRRSDPPLAVDPSPGAA